MMPANEFTIIWQIKNCLTPLRYNPLKRQINLQVVKRGKMIKYLSLFLVLIACVSCQSTTENKNKIREIDASEINYREHIVVKGGDEKHVVYEYSDVRVDDVATLAAAYCNHINPEYQANLRDIYMYKNHKRRATFDCEYIAQR